MSNGNGSKFDADAFARALEPAFKGLGEVFGKKIDELGTRLDNKIDELGTRLDNKIDQLGTRLDGKIDDLGDRLEAAIVNQSGHYRSLEARVERIEGVVFPRKT